MGLEDVADPGARAFGPLPGEAADRDVGVCGVAGVDGDAGDVAVGQGAVDRQIQLVPAGAVGVADRDPRVNPGPSQAPPHQAA